MAKSRRLTRKYKLNGIDYGPETPPGQVPQQLWDREEELKDPKIQKKLARRYGGRRTPAMRDLVPESTGEPMEEEEAPSPVEATASANATVTPVEEESEGEDSEGE